YEPGDSPRTQLTPEARGRGRSSLSGLLDLELLRVRAVRLQHELAQALLRRWVVDSSQQRETTSLAIGGELTCPELDALACAVAPCPDGKADQPQAIELAAGEMEFSVRELAGRHVAVANDLHEDVHGATSCEARHLAGDVRDWVVPLRSRAPLIQLLLAWHREAVSQPVLQCVRINEDRIGRREPVVAFAVVRLL